MDLSKYRSSDREQARTESLMRLVPRGLQTVLDVGARDGFMSRALTAHFEQVVALDLEKPQFVIERVQAVKGDITALDFGDNSIDVVFCAEVLEHIPPVLLPKACRELARVARVAVVVGVPFRQDLRVGRTRCARCGHVNPPWGHVNRFDDQRLVDLFRPLTAVETDFVWPTRQDRTNFVSAMLMSAAGFPWGTYDQEEPCTNCHSALARPGTRTTFQRASARLSALVDSAQRRFARLEPTWIHIRFDKAVRSAASNAA